MHLPERYLDPGVWDATAWLRQQGIGVVGSLKASGITFTHGPPGVSFACWLHSVQQAGSQRLIDFAGSPRHPACRVGCCSATKMRAC